MGVLHTQNDLKLPKPDLFYICAMIFALSRNTRITDNKASCFSRNVIMLQSLHFVVKIVVIVLKCFEMQYANCHGAIIQNYIVDVTSSMLWMKGYETLSWVSIVMF